MGALSRYRQAISITRRDEISPHLGERRGRSPDYCVHKESGPRKDNRSYPAKDGDFCGVFVCLFRSNSGGNTYHIMDVP